MKLKLYGLEIYEVAKKYPPFVLDTTEYPQLELEIMAVAQAEDIGDPQKTHAALEELYVKMYDTPAKGSVGDVDYSIDIMSAVAPFDGHDEATEDYGDETLLFKLVAVDDEASSS